MHPITLLSLSSILAIAEAGVVRRDFSLIKPFKDRNCKEPLKMEQREEGAQPEALESLRIDKHLNEGAGGRYYDSLYFPDADAEKPGVYWEIPEPSNPFCTFILMEESQGGWQSATKLPGRVKLLSNKAGCYYTSLEPGVGLITSVCCGDKACAPADMGSTLLTGTYTTQEEDASKMKCEIKDPKAVEGDQGFRTAGPQIKLDHPQWCDKECKFQISNTIELGSTLSMAQEHSVGTEETITITAEAGLSFGGGGFSMSTGYSSTFSETFTQSSGREWSETRASTIGRELSQMEGTRAMVTFMPTYVCKTVEYKCTVKGAGGREYFVGHDISPEERVLGPMVNHCHPQEIDGIAQGEYTVVYLGLA